MKTLLKYFAFIIPMDVKMVGYISILLKTRPSLKMFRINLNTNIFADSF